MVGTAETKKKSIKTAHCFVNVLFITAVFFMNITTGAKERKKNGIKTLLVPSDLVGKNDIDGTDACLCYFR